MSEMQTKNRIPTAAWPEIPFEAWRETSAALHLFTQIVGKYRLARTPWVNHSWHATLYVTPRGLTTALVPDGDLGVEVKFDFFEQRLIAEATGGHRDGFALEPMSVADFHARFLTALETVGATPEFHGRPNELPDPLPFRQDRKERPWDGEAVRRFHAALVSVEGVFQQFRTGFLGKVSPVHLFWGSFDLAVTRFSGRPAPMHPGGIPALPDEVTREAYSHEVSSAGFWPGGGPIDAPAFYSYAYPTPEGFGAAPVQPAEAYFDTAAGEFILPYDAVRQAADPRAALLSFLQSTYDAAANLGGWQRAAMDCPSGQPLRPRPLSPGPYQG
ncbi:DUF5996 family protein [Algihabitans albus]|uniref:DUF5996 family protein n=1 Tax=Algihabitans albus TaxID=2164067 RepID=UPI001ABC55A3|nr:DUF5996 family protein [Algihabitans albus]